MVSAKTLGQRVREVRGWHRLALRQAAARAGMSAYLWGQIERGDIAVPNRNILDAMTHALWVHPSQLTGQPWAPTDHVSSEAHAGLIGIEIALDRYELEIDPQVPVRSWPQITANLQHLITHLAGAADYAQMGAVIPVVLGELHDAYRRFPQHRTEILIGMMRTYALGMWITKHLGVRAVPSVAALCAQDRAQALGDPVWLGYVAFLRGQAGGFLDRRLHYRRSVAAAESLTSKLDSPDALQACGMLHLSAAWAAAVQADRDAVATHLAEASALAARMDTEVGSWAGLWFGPTNVGIWTTSLALELGDHAQALQAAGAVRPELIPSASRQAEFWIDLGRAMVARKKTREKGLRLLMHAEGLAPQRVRHDIFARETIADLLRQARRQAGGLELRGLAARLGASTPIE
ncbi:MAG: helix-turn-helix domain-containing protein [Pseudonocardiaceae bacterium]